jgi:hypothetical protein
MNLAKAWFLVDNKHTWDHLVDASISVTIHPGKYRTIA